MVDCKPRVDEDVVWVSYWPIGNKLNVSDEVSVDIIWEKGTMRATGCSASLVYMDDGAVDEEETCENQIMKEEEVIGGDLSEFEVATGCYYLCRRDLFGLKTSHCLKFVFDDNVQYTDSQGWRKTHQLMKYREWRDYSLNTYRTIIEVGVSCSSESEIDKIEKTLSSIVGVESVSAHKETGELIVTSRSGNLCETIAVEILSVKPNVDC